MAKGKTESEATMKLNLITSALAVLIIGGPTSAHVHKDMDYRAYKMPNGVSCCNNQDCEAVADFVEATDNGKPVIRLLLEGTWVTVGREKVVAEDAQDGRAHWCGKMDNGAFINAKPVTYCIILPPRGT